MSDEGFQDFLEEAKESLTDLEESITTLTDDENLVDELNLIFRHIHSIKGASSFFKFESLAQTSHKLENLLDQLRKFEKNLTDEIKEILGRGFFMLQEMVERGINGNLDMTEQDQQFIDELVVVLEGSGGDDIGKLIQNIEEGQYEDLDAVKKALEAMVSNGEDDAGPPLHSNLVEIRDLVKKQMTEDYPEGTAKVKGKVQELFVYYTEQGQEGSIQPLKDFLEDYRALAESPVGIDEMLGDVLLDQLLNANHDMIKADEEIEKKKKEKAAPVKKADEKEAKAPAAPVEASVRIKVQLLEEMMNLMGELVLSRNQLKSYTDDLQENELGAIAQNISGIISELQERVMKTRLQPVSIIFKPLPGVVREIARTLNKKVKLVTEGQDTELDRSVLNGIKDPLTHVLRNSLDHGIETQEKRQKSGKVEEATIELKAYYEGSMVVIEITDDGQGVNVEKVKEKALENGLLTADALDKLSEQEVCQLIFKAGFSTADQVSEVSGRGVGMDVVRSNIENLGGFIELDSKWGKGTVLKFKIPLTLAIIPALVVEAGGVKYSLPQESLTEMVLVKAHDAEEHFEEINGTMVFRLRGNILPVIKLNQLLNLPEPEQEPEAMHVIVLKAGHNTFGLAVEVLHDIEEIVVKTLDHYLEGHSLFSGATILGDGSISLIIDTLLISERFEMAQHRNAIDSMESRSSYGSHEEGQLLVFRLSPTQFYGVILDEVYRLENIKSSRIESLSGRWFLQYRGGVLPLISSWEVMNTEQDQLPDDVNIIVFVNDGKEVGLVVGNIEDALSLTEPIVKDIVLDERILGSSIVDNKVITILDLKYLAKIGTSSISKEKVLLWDDVESSRHEYAEQLRKQGYDVNEVSSKQEASDLIDAQDVDIVVTSTTVSESEVQELTNDVKADMRMVNLNDTSIDAIDYQKTLDSTQLSEGIQDLLQSK